MSVGEERLRKGFVSGSLGKITSEIQNWYHMHAEMCLEHYMHMSLCEMSYT
jgi:hypothetical protein